MKRVCLMALALALALAVPAVAGAAHPIKGRYYNGSAFHGAYLVTTHHTIRTLWLFCRQPKWDHTFTPERRHSRYEIRDLVPVSRNGSFHYRGTADRYGAEGGSLGRWRIRLSGRFVTSRRVVITRHAADCAGGSRASARAVR
jgi:hypothetical protein